MLGKIMPIVLIPVMMGLAPMAGSAMAQDASPPAVPHRLRDKFAAANVTHDGHLTLAQAQAGAMPMVVRHFGSIDADHKGYATLADIKQFIAVRRAARQGPAPAVPPTQ
jgi:hypothetical protein